MPEVGTPTDALRELKALGCLRPSFVVLPYRSSDPQARVFAGLAHSLPLDQPS